MDTLPVEVIEKILSFLTLIDRVKCESINWKFFYICKNLWTLQAAIDENELPPIKWIRECEIMYPDRADEFRSNLVRWHLTLKCPNIKKIVISDDELSSTFFSQQLPFLQHLTVKNFSDNFVILKTAKRLETIVFEKSHCNEYEVIKHLTENIKSIEGPSICDPWVNKWDEFFQHSDSSRFQNLVKLTVVITLRSEHHFSNIMQLENLQHVRFLIGDDFDNHLLIKYLQHRGSKLNGLELFQPNYHTSCRNVCASVSNSCSQLKHLGIKGNFHGKADYDLFKSFLFNFKSLVSLSINIPKPLTHEDVDTLCDNNHNLRELKYTYYMPSISPMKLRNCRRHCKEGKIIIDNYNTRNPGKRKIAFETSEVVKNILSNSL